MSRDNYFDKKVEQFDKLERQKERRERWNQREKKFFGAFLFTENGKPKSSLMIYTFSLSFLFLAIYGVALFLLIDWLQPLVESWPAALGNLLVVALSTGLGVILGAVLHELFPDKRLVFGAHIWLALYDIAAFITVALFLRGDAGFSEFTAFFGWFFVPPVAVGCLVFYYLFRRDYEPPKSAPAPEPWHKYTRR